LRANASKVLPPPSVKNRQSFDDFGIKTDFNIFPNPASETVNVSLQGFEGNDLKIHLIDQLGKRIQMIDLTDVSDAVYPIDLKNIPNGIYTVWIFPEGEKPIGKKLIIK